MCGTGGPSGTGSNDPATTTPMETSQRTRNVVLTCRDGTDITHPPMTPSCPSSDALCCVVVHHGTDCGIRTPGMPAALCQRQGLTGKGRPTTHSGDIRTTSHRRHHTDDITPTAAPRRRHSTAVHGDVPRRYHSHRIGRPFADAPVPFTTFGDATRHRRRTHPAPVHRPRMSPAARPCNNGNPAARHAAMPPQSIATLRAPSSNACPSHLCARQGQPVAPVAPVARVLPTSTGPPWPGGGLFVERQPRPASGQVAAASLQNTSILPA